MKVVFVYSGGREGRSAEVGGGRMPSEFFYGAIEMANRGECVDIIDFRDFPHSSAAALGNRLIGDLLPVRVRTEHLIGAFKLVRRLESAEVVVATSSYLALALGSIRALGFSVPPIVAIHCGIANHPPSSAKRLISREILNRQTCVFFSSGEARVTAETFGLKPDGVHGNPFGVDTGFWCPSDSPVAGEYILSVGNDARRDYEVLMRAAEHWQLPVRVITARPLPAARPANVDWMQGSWHQPAVNDLELRDLYRNARVVVVPLQDAPQPSGQSVALQAMACGRPVVMTKTRGLWTGGDFSDGSHLVLVPPADPLVLARAVHSLVIDPARAMEIGDAARARTLTNGSIETFATRLQQLCAEAAAWHGTDSRIS